MKKKFSLIKKKILSVSLVGAILAFSTATFTACKDYDDDIDGLNQKIESLKTDKLAPLEKQLNSLQTTINSLEQANNALQEQLKKEIDDAVKVAQTTLQSNIDALRKYCDDSFLTKASADQTYAKVADVADAIALAKGLKTYNTDAAIKKAIDDAVAAAVSANGEAFKAAFETRFSASLDQALSSETGKEGEIYKAIKKAIDEYDAQMHDCLTKALKENGAITEAISKAISDAQGELTSELKKWVSHRLTSVSLIPEYYVNGIEAIQFKSLSYKTWTVDQTTEMATQEANISTTAFSSTKVRYNISPTVVTEGDIKDPEFIYENAEVKTRAAVTNQLLTVVGKEIKNGVLTVDVKKASGISLTPSEANHIYTAALKVPLADKYINEGEGGSAVYSDYAMLDETTVEPKIAALIDKNSTKTQEGKFECKTDHYHFSATYTDAQAANPSITQAYNKPIDLLLMVTGCYVENGAIKEITKNELNAAGLEFRFAVPTLKYELGDNGTDQQQFAKVKVDEDGTTLVSKLPDGLTNNQAAIDKSPIVRVELIDVNNNNAIVDVRYFKIQWVRENISSVDLGILKTFEYTLNCNDFTGKMTWLGMVDTVLGKLGENGMSQNEFIATYGVPTIKADDHTAGTVDKADGAGVEFVYNYDNDADQSAAAFTWKLTTEQIGKVMNTNGKQTVFKKKVNVTIPAKNEYQGKLTFSFVVNIKLPTLPAINGYDTPFWETDGELANVYPVQYNTPTATTDCEYNYELDRLFADSKVLKNMLPCGKWDIQFAKTQPEKGYAPALTGSQEPAKDNDQTGYTLKKGAEEAVKLNFNPSMGNNWYAPATTTPNAVNMSDIADITVSVVNNAAGKGILDKNATLKVWAAINPYNFYEVADFDVHFVAPLKINTNLDNAYFVDQVISGSEVDCAKAFTLTDFKDYIVAKVTTGSEEKEMYAADLYTYYVVQDPVWDLTNAKTNLKKDGDGNYVVDETITADKAQIKAADRFGVNCITQVGSKLIFKNINGVKVEKTVKIFIPVTVTHKWGVLTADVTIELRPE